MSAFALGLANGAAARRGFAAASRRSASPLFRTIQARPKDQRSCADRLLMRQTACARRFLPAMIGGGTWEGAHARHEAAGVRHAARRRGGGVAARGARAAAERSAADRFPAITGSPGAQAGRRRASGRVCAIGLHRRRTNMRIEYRWSAGDVERLPRFAAELVRLGPDVIVALLRRRSGALASDPHRSDRVSRASPIRLAPGLSRALRDRAAMLLALTQQ